MNFYQATEVGNTRYGPGNFQLVRAEAWIMEIDFTGRAIDRRDISSYRVVGVPSPEAQLPSTHF